MSVYRGYFALSGTDPQGLRCQDSFPPSKPAQYVPVYTHTPRRPKTLCAKYPSENSFVAWGCWGTCGWAGEDGNNAAELGNRARYIITENIFKGFRDNPRYGPKSGLWPRGFWSPHEFDSQGNLDGNVSRKHSAIRHCIWNGLLARTSSCACAQCVTDKRDLWQYHCNRPNGQSPRNTREAFYNDKMGRLCAGCRGGNATGMPEKVELYDTNFYSVTYLFASEAEIVNCCFRKLLRRKARD